MNILITNASYGGNKGAEAMITTLVHKVSKNLSDSTTFYIDSLPKHQSYFYKIQKELAAEGIKIEPVLISPKKVLFNALYGLRDDNKNCIKIDRIIDISGLSFVDNNLRDLFRTYLKNISLPSKIKQNRFTQDYGPAENFSTKIIAKIILSKAAKIFPRSDLSRKLVQKLTRPEKITRVYPDSAILLPLKKSNYSIENGAIIVPNEHSYKKYKQKYIDSISEIIKYLKDIKLNIYLIQHSFTGDGDFKIINMIKEKYPEIITITENIDSRELKHLISQAQIVVASRYHAVIAALSTNVPCVTIGWNPKYEELYKTYKLNFSDSIDSAFDLVRWNINNNKKIRSDLQLENHRIKKAVDKSFEELMNEINSY